VQKNFMTEEANRKEYTDSDIQRLECHEAIRLRPRTYLQDEANRPNCLLREALCLSLAEAHCGTCTKIDVVVDGLTAKISNNGIGLDTTPNRFGGTKVEDLFTVLSACRDEKSHRELGHQLCKFGVVIVTALSDILKVRIHSGGNIHRIAFADGRTVNPLAIIGETNRTGTQIEFTIGAQFVDDEVFDLEALRESIAALDIDLSRTEINFSGA